MGIVTENRYNHKQCLFNVHVKHFDIHNSIVHPWTCLLSVWNNATHDIVCVILLENTDKWKQLYPVVCFEI